MRRIWWTLLFTLFVPRTPAAEVGLRARPLVPCGVELGDLAVSQEFAERILDRYRNITIHDLPFLRGHLLTTGRKRVVRERVPLPTLSYGSFSWTIQNWSRERSPAYFYSVGSRNLEKDAAHLHASMIALLQRPDGADGVLMEADENRRTDLMNLQRFQTAFERRAKEVHRIGLDGLNKSLAAQESRTLNSNSDIIGVLDRRLRASASRRAIENAILVAMKITYSPSRDFVRPNFHGLMAELGLASPASVYLPSLTRLDADRRKRFDVEFTEFFGTDPVCEFGFVREMRKNVPAHLRQRLLLEGYHLARQRKCKTIMLSATERDAAEFVSYGFRAWRGTPLENGRREKLYVLDVKSPAYNSAISDLNLMTKMDQVP